MKKLILASTSPRRTELLKSAGIEHECIAPLVDEEKIENEMKNEAPERIVEALSKAKACAVKETVDRDDIIVLGADTVVVFDGRIFGKPKDKSDARAMIKAFSGNSHIVFTGVTLLYEDKCITFHERSEVFFDEITDEELEDYLATNEPYDKAGAYAVQGSFSKFIRSINGNYDNIVGLPVAAVYQALKKLQRK